MGRRCEGRWGRLAVGGLLTLVLGCQPDPAPVGSHPTPLNLLLIVVDTLRQDHLQCYGYPRATAPTLCRLASEGAHLDAVSPTAWTKPAVASLLTGLHPLRHQAISRRDRLPAAAVTLAEILASRRFHTFGVSASGWVSPEFGFGQGFQELLTVPVPGPETPPDGTRLNALLFPALERLRSPFFLYVHYTDPHDPYDPAVAWDGSPLDERLRAKAPLRAGAVAASRGHRGRPLVQDAIDLYDGEIRSVDVAIGRLLGRMETLGLLRRTLTVITSDHGEEFQEHGRAGHGHSLYREVTRVPLIVHAPQVIAPRSEGGSATLTDVVPTVLDLFGIDAIADDGPRHPPSGSPRFDGTSFGDWLRGESRSRGQATAIPARAVTQRRGAPIDHLLHLDLDGRAALAALRGTEKLILATVPYTKELFDLEGDPSERHDLTGDGDAGLRFPRLAEDLALRYNELATRALPRRQTRLRENVEGLRALGYLAGTPREASDRALPRRIRPADPPPGGFLGWEQPRRFESCVETAEPRFATQLLDGWYPVEPRFGGRWTHLSASLVVAPPDSWSETATLDVTGHRPDEVPDEVPVDVTINGELVASPSVGGGQWTLSIPVEPLPDEPSSLVVRLAVRSRVPPREADRDPPRGLFVRSVCLSQGGGPP